jgi:hypothetical protein
MLSISALDLTSSRKKNLFLVQKKNGQLGIDYNHKMTINEQSSDVKRSETVKIAFF